MNRASNTISFELGQVPWLRVGLWLMAVFFLLFYTILAYNNRLLGDDIQALVRLIENGWLGSVIDFKYNRRIAGLLIFNSIFVLNPDLESLHVQLFIFHEIMLLASILSFGYLTKVAVLRPLGISLSMEAHLLLSTISICGLFFFTFRWTEVWFWASASVIHLVPLVFLLWGLAEVKDRNHMRLLRIFGCFFVIGGSSEAFVLTSYTILIFIGFRLDRSSEQFRASRTKILVGLSGLSILFLLNLMGLSGIKNRIALEHSSASFDLFTGVKGLCSFILEPKNLVLLGIVALSFFIGNHSKGITIKPEFRNRLVKDTIILILLATACTFIPLWFVFGNFGPPRVWMPFGAALAFSSLIFSFLLGHSLRRFKSILFSMITCVLVAAAISTYIVRQAPLVFKYSEAYDDRTKLILDSKAHIKNSSRVLSVPELPNSGMLIRSRLEPNPNGWQSQLFKRALLLDFQIQEESSWRDSEPLDTD